MQITIVIDSFEELGRLKAMLDGNDIKQTVNDIKQTVNDNKQEQTKSKPGRKPMDVGKIHALKNAGWSADQIADEMGCSKATVYKCLHR